MSLSVIVVNAVNVPKESFGKSDPYCELQFQGTKKKTEVKKDEVSPEWNEKLDYDLQGVALTQADSLHASIFDWERVGRNKLLGECTIALRDLLGRNAQDLTVQLLQSSGQPVPGCQLTVKLLYTPPKGAGAGGDTSGDIVDAGASQGAELGMMEDSDDDLDEVDAGGDPNQPGGRSKRKKRKRKRGTTRNYSRKSQDFQVRVKIVEGRQLQGSNISPVCKISVYNQTKATRIKKSANAPVWNETFFFNFLMSPAELFDELMQFEVFNSRKLRSDSLIGSFKCDVGMVYESANHTLLHKWLLLSDPNDSSAGPKGYLKICVTILGPGDEAPSFKAPPGDDDQDVESNLLRPAGVQLRPATFWVKVFRAEDIPRMDSDFIEGVKKVLRLSEEKKELVDPYAIVSFAGTELKTKIMYCSDHPEWNQQLNLKIKFPSMCQRLKVQVMDWDRLMTDDAVGCIHIKMSEISSSGGDGFLPMFGPCYQNLYGSPREYSDLPDENDDLNTGKGEGCAYRGRILLQMGTDLGEQPELNVEDINSDDVLRVQKFMRRRKYKLHVTFLNATMINAVDAPVEFEVSIGNYGNKLDENVPPCSSTTQPTNAVYDGNYYYFLPWGDTKPCCVVDSSWEDISFRLETLNLLQRTVDRLESNIQKIKIGLKANLDIRDTAQFMVSLLDQLITDCQKPIPEPEPGRHSFNDLDLKQREYRIGELQNIVNEANKLHNSATDIQETLVEIEGFLSILKGLAVEPQNSMPDVVIWMISGDKRIAYHRIPANEVLYSTFGDYCGRSCGKLQAIALKYPGSKAVKEGIWEIPGLLRIKIWLGLEKYEMEWHHMQTEGDMAVFAETYENQVNFLGWGTKGPTMTRPKWSDTTGKVKLTKESFVPPPGWHWEGDWYINPELSLLFDADSGHNTFLEDIYEFQARIPAGSWGGLSHSWMNVKGDETPSKDELALPEGWKWSEDWQVDVNRAVDEEGWEYCVEATVGGYGPCEKNYHMCRRRRWVRGRTLVVDRKKLEEKEKKLIAASEGWEYAPLFNMKFHVKERKMDMVRRRRWHRKMVAEKHGASCFFAIQAEGKDAEEYAASLTAPRMFLTFKQTFKYQLRAYIYQARDLLAGDSTGLSDPFARVCFLHQSQNTETVDKSLCPTWDQTLIFEEMEIPGDPQMLVTNPPEVFMELFDYDTFGTPDFLGRSRAIPLVKIDPTDERVPALQWYNVKKGDQYGGEVLASFELFLMNGSDLPFMPPKKGDDTFIVPTGIRPVMQRTGIEVLCWGVRNMKKYQLLKCTSPGIEFEINGYVITSTPIKNTKKNPNFTTPTYFFDVMLPKEELYMPPMNIRVRDHRQFGRKPLVGLHTVKELEIFRDRTLPTAEKEMEEQVAGQQQQMIDGEFIVEMPIDVEPVQEAQVKKKKASALLEEEIDWWSKYYASTGELAKCKQFLDKGYKTFEIFTSELEKVQDFNDFNDFCHSFELHRGKQVDDEEPQVAGEFKGSFRIYQLPPDPNVQLPPKHFDILPSSEPEECVVRLYVIQAFDLQPMDPGGKADPYLHIKLGKKKMNNRDDYIPNELSPVFGKMFETTTFIPNFKDLTITVKDYDLLSTDDVIGETVIDLENRLLTKFRATCGLSKQYCTSGPNQWKDALKPMDILKDYCLKNKLGDPVMHGNSTIKVGNTLNKLADFEKNLVDNGHLGPPDERLALHVLNTLPLVPEHIETRPLYNPLQPGIEQGKLQMWVDIFPKSLGPPGPPANVEQRRAKRFELRVIIWNTKDVILEETSITGEKMSDIYCKCWIAGIDDQQSTDVHYRSLDGEGNFNWRMVFPFDYIPAEQVMSVKKKEHFWNMDETEQKLPPILMVQIWDNDKFSADDFLGTLELNINNMAKPVKKSRSCDLDQIPDISTGKEIKTISLFEARRLKGYWPCYSDETGERLLTGKAEMELEIVTEEEAETRPAGLGQDEPNMNPHLDPPKRPETSFLWFTSPWKTLKHIIWHNYKWYIIGGIILIIVVLLIVLFVYSIPGAGVDKIFGL